MAKVQQCVSAANASTATNSTNFVPIITGSGTNVWPFTEAQESVPVRTSGTFSNLYTRVTVSTAFVQTLSFRINSVDGNQVVSVPSSNTGEFTDSVNTDSPSAGQTVNVNLSGSSTGAAILSISIVFAASSGTVGRIGSAATSLGFTAGTWFTSIGMDGTITTPESSTQTEIQACTLQNLAVYCVTKGRSKADTVQLRKNATNGNMTVSVAGTGLVEDTTNTDSIAANDNINWTIVTGSGAGTDNLQFVSCEQSTSNSTFHYICSNQINVPVTLAFGNTNFIPVACQIVYTNYAAESDAKLYSQIAGTLTLLDANVPTNTVNGTTTITLRDSGISSALVVSIGSSATGLFQDSAHSDSVSVGDELNYQIVSGGTSGAITIAAIAMLMSVTTGPSTDQLIAAMQFGSFQPYLERLQIVDY